MSETAKSGAGSLGRTDARLTELEAENARLRAQLAERDEAVRQLQGAARRESQIRLVADSLPVLISYVDSERSYRFVNRGYEVWFGHDRSEIVGKRMAEVLGDAAYEKARPWIDKALMGERVSYDALLPYRDGGPRFVHVEYVPDRRESGRVAGFFALVSDISESKRVEQSLRESEARFRDMADSAPAPVWVTGVDGIEFVNKAFVEVAGIPADQLTGEIWMSLIHADDLPQVLEERARAWEARSGYAYDARFRNAEGEWRWMHVSCKPRLDEQDRLIGYVGLAVDVTEQKRAADELRESEARFRAMADSAPAPIWVTNEVGIEFANQALSAFTGLSVEQLKGDAWIRLAHAEDLPAVQERRIAAWRKGEPYEFEARFRRHDGEWRWLRCSCNPRQTSGEFLGYVGLGIDITEARRAEQELRESEARFRRIADSSPVIMWVTRPDRRRDFVNQAYLEFLGVSREEAADFDWRRLIHPEDVERIVAASIAGEASLKTFALEGRYRRADGEWRWLRSVSQPRFDADGEPNGFIGVAHDVTEMRRAEEALRDLNQTLETRIAAAVAERERAEEALRQSQKMEAVGQLTGGIAHDFNNLLTVIAGNLDMIQRRLGPGTDERVLRAVNSALVGAERAATLTQRLLAFSRRQPLSPKPIDVNELVGGMSELLHRALGETVEVETALAPDLWRVEVDPHQLENAILNVAVNARDAMPNGGRLTIETANADFASEGRGRQGEPTSGDYVLIRMTDTGSGMDQDMLARACEPFFTTKEVGKGTGLGLSMVYGFVKQSGGYFRLESEPGKGTSASIYLPRLHAGVAAAEADRQAQDAQGGFNETILVCEDDPDVRAYTVEVLRELGYQVIEAEDGPTALRLLEADGEGVDLLFTDVVLPGGMTGAELAQLARAERPHLRVLFTTGYARDAIVHDGRIDPGVELITKPFAQADLAGRIREVLDGGSEERVRR